MDKMMEVGWSLHMVLLMACLKDQHWGYNLDLLTEKHLDLMKASYLALHMVNYLALHVGLMMESQLGLIIEAHLVLMMDMIWVPQIAHLMVPMMANLWVHFLVFQLDKMLGLSYVILMVLFDGDSYGMLEG